MGDYPQAIQRWVKIQRSQGHEARATELMQTLERSGYKGYLSKDAQDNEFEGNLYCGGLAPSAATDYAMLGEKDAAFAALEKAFAHRIGVVDINVDPRLDTIRSHPRFADLLHRVGF
jgi:hypothetical protein